MAGERLSAADCIFHAMIRLRDAKSLCIRRALVPLLDRPPEE